MPGLGDEFRAAREARHLSLSDVSEQIHIRSVYLQSIEDEDWASIAAPVYVRGFIRTYARFLGIAPEEAVERFNLAMGDAGQRHEPAAVRKIGTSRRGPSPWLWIAIAVAVVLVGFVGYRAFDSIEARANGPDSAPVAAASASASPASSADASASPSSGGSAIASDASPSPAPKGSPTPPAGKEADSVVVSVTQTSWLLVKVDGEKIVEGTYLPGTLKKFTGKTVAIRAGNAGGIDLTVAGKHEGPLGKLGSVVDKTITLAGE